MRRQHFHVQSMHMGVRHYSKNSPQAASLLKNQKYKAMREALLGSRLHPSIKRVELDKLKARFASKIINGKEEDYEIKDFGYL